jgi:prephenate dehydrogenase
MIETVLILGSNGGFGRLFSALLVAEGARIHGVDLAGDASGRIPCERYVRCDLSRPSSEVLAFARDADCILMCLPESVALAAVEPLMPALRPGTLVTDILSVKTRIAAKMGSLRGDIDSG